MTFSNIVAHGPGPCKIHGHVNSLLENITFDNVRLTVDADPDAPWQKAPVAMTIENARDIKLNDFKIMWQAPTAPHWQSALVVNNVTGLTLDGVSVRQADNDTEAPAVQFNGVFGAVIRNCEAQPGTGTFLQVVDPATHDVVLLENDLRQAATPVALAGGSRKAVQVGWGKPPAIKAIAAKKTAKRALKAVAKTVAKAAKTPRRSAKTARRR
jgi:hypothetical protein